MKLAGGATQNPVEIRIKNDSSVDFDRVQVQFPDQNNVDYGPIPKSGASEFRAVSRAYRYAGVSVQVGDEEWSLQPIDYLGEAELAAGRYTYSLDVENGQITLTLERIS
jgi:hypothetical protein